MYVGPFENSIFSKFASAKVNSNVITFVASFAYCLRKECPENLHEGSHEIRVSHNFLFTSGVCSGNTGRSV